METRRHWRRLALAGARYAGRRSQFELSYLRSDPWDMESDVETSRLDWTARLIARRFARVGTLLELGCGEGHLSVRLAKHCERLFGLDVSRLAVARCRKRCPRGLFKVGDSRLAFTYAPLIFDLVVACETIYYMRNVGEAIAKMSGLGRACLVTYREDQFDTLDPWFEAIVEGDELHTCGHSAWRAVWWRSPPIPGGLVAERLQ